LFIQTRPNVNRYTALMGKFVNNTGTNAAEIAISYQLTMAGALSLEDSGKGTHVYYSLTGLAGSWTALPALNNITNSGSYALRTNVAIVWPNGICCGPMTTTAPEPTSPMRSTISRSL
jgi:hypothetical protein